MCSLSLIFKGLRFLIFMEHCLLFGGTGHLAQTKIIPALQKENIDYTIISRRQKQNLKVLYDKPNVISFLSIPTQHLQSVLTSYSEDLSIINPTIIIEKPHGNSYKNFKDICKFLETNNFDFIFNDHYLFKKNILFLENIKSNFNKIKTIKIVINENECINKRIDYFDNVGILLDMYQSHVLMLFVKLLSQIYPTTDDYEILQNLSKTHFEIQERGKYYGYHGEQDTFITLKLKYKDIFLECDLAKNVEYTNKNIYLFDEKKILIDTLSLDDESYGTMIRYLKYDCSEYFLNSNQINYLWKHMEYNCQFNTNNFTESCLL